MTTTNSKFENKEHYLAFRKAWATAVNSDKAKHTLTKNDWGVSRVCGWVQSEHHILYNILRNRPFHTGFTPITNKNKLQHGAYVNHGMYWGMWGLKSHIRWAKKQLEQKKKILSRFSKDKDIPTSVDRFLEPFDGTVTLEMLASIELPEVKPIESNFGKGRTVAAKIISGEAKPITYQDVQDLYEAA